MALPAGQLEPSCLQMSHMPQMHPSAAANSTGFGLDMVVNNPYAPAGASCPVPVSAAASVSVAAGPSTTETEPCLNVNGTAAWDIGSRNLFGGFVAQFQSVESE